MIGNILINLGYISCETLERALQIQERYKQQGRRELLGEILRKRKYISDFQLNHALNVQ